MPNLVESFRKIDLLELNAWSSKWLMSFNPEKTEMLFFSNTGNMDNIEFSFNGKDFILKNNWSSLRYLRSDSVSQPVSAYKYSDFGKMGKPVTILAASN
jgi:hypothetical protein